MAPKREIGSPKKRMKLETGEEEGLAHSEPQREVFL